ncbi:RNA-binding domain-containing protein [Backusella circina FSU 941]|nr:RNA-binding domain-containing protein [Backusella circina FSU 941]
MDIQANFDGSKVTLWMGDLESWMDEQFIRNVWFSLGENVIVKLIRDKRTGISAGYAFVGFSSNQAAQKALIRYHGIKMPNSQQPFRLNWASGGGIWDRKEDRLPEFSLFVGDLNSDIEEDDLLHLFHRYYPSCHSARIMTDPLTGLSRGYGFVRFSNQNEQQDAVLKMNGVVISNRPIRVSFATPKNNSLRYLQLAAQAPALIQPTSDPTNTTVFIGGLSSIASEDEIMKYFEPFGEINYVKIPTGKNCGFVQYTSRSAAEQAIEQMNGFLIGSSRIRLAWGRSQNEKSNKPPPLTTSSTITTPPHSHLQQYQTPFLPNTPSLGGFDDDLPRIPNHFLDGNSPPTNYHRLGSFSPLSPPQNYREFFSSPPLQPTFHHQQQTSPLDWLMRGKQD